MKFVFPIMVLTGLWLTGCGGSSHRSATPTAAASVTVQALRLTTAEWPATYEVTGTVRARTASVISAKVMGYVREVHVQVGDRVRQGQVLVRLDSRDLDASWRQAQAALAEARSAVPEAENAVAAAKAGLELAQVTFRRMEDLFRKRSISNQEFDEASAKLKLAQANYEMAQSRRRQLDSKIQQAEQALQAAAVARSYAEITAPFDGVVTEKSVEPGNLAAPGTPLLVLERAQSYRLEVPVEESRWNAVRLGQPVSVRLEALNRILEGRVAEIAPGVDAAARSFVVKIDLPAVEGLRSGLFARAVFPLGRRKLLAVPASAVLTRGQLTAVYVVEDQRARLRLVTLGNRAGDRVEVLSGLSEGDLVIAPVPTGLTEGAPVEVRS